MTNNVSPLIDLNLHELFGHSPFDPKSRLNVQNLDLNEQVLKTSDAIEQLNAELNELVSNNYKELIERTRKINELEYKFDNVQKNILNLLAVLDKLKSILSEPYKEIAQRISLNQSISINRLQTTCDLMRRIIRIFSFTKILDAEPANDKLQERTDLSNFNHKELIRKALCLNEVNQLLEEDKLLYQIDVIKNDLDKFKQEQSNLTQISLKIMDIGLSKQDITMLTNSLQIFCLFNDLEQVIKKFLEEKEQLIVETINSTFNVKTNQQMLACLPEKKLDNTDSLQLIKAKLNECDTLILNVVTPFFDSIRDLPSDILITMHTEKYTPNSSDNSCSLYMKELYGFLLRVQSDYLKLFHNHEVLTSCLTSISISCIELFLRHATIVRQQKLPDVVKSKLSNDCDKLQQVIQQLGVKPSDLGKSYRILRAFRPTLKQDLNEIAKSAVIGNMVPYSMSIHYLIAAFSSEIQLPHEMMSWSIPRYTKWCDDNNDEQTKIEILRQCLENYVKKVGQRQDLKQFPQDYCVILELLEAAKRSND